MAQELGNGWVAALDPGSGRTYYANTVTVRTRVSYLPYPHPKIHDVHEGCAAAPTAPASTLRACCVAVGPLVPPSRCV